MNNPSSQAQDPVIRLLSDDPEWRATRTNELVARGFEVVPLAAEAATLVVADLASADLVRLAGECRDLRREYPEPLVVMAATAEETAQILCLELGADDFLPRDVSAALLAARIKTLLRICAERGATTVGALQVDPERREVRRGERTISLTTLEFDLLWMMARNIGKVLPRDRIHRELFSSEYNGLDRTVDIYVSKIRKKIDNNRGGERLIKTVRGTGYMMVRQ